MSGEATVLGPVVLWIGILRVLDTLIGEGAFNSANSLLELLKRYCNGITDVNNNSTSRIENQCTVQEIGRSVQIRVEPRLDCGCC